jgi:hypothetical protein
MRSIFSRWLERLAIRNALNSVESGVEKRLRIIKKLIFISIILSSVILIGYEGHDVYVDYLRNLIDSKTSELETKNKELEAKLSEIDKLNNEVESRSLLLDELAKSKDVTRYTFHT